MAVPKHPAYTNKLLAEMTRHALTRNYGFAGKLGVLMEAGMNDMRQGYRRKSNAAFTQAMNYRFTISWRLRLLLNRESSSPI